MENLALTEIRSPEPPGRSESGRKLSQPGPRSDLCIFASREVRATNSPMKTVDALAEITTGHLPNVD